MINTDCKGRAGTVRFSSCSNWYTVLPYTTVTADCSTLSASFVLISARFENRPDLHSRIIAVWFCIFLYRCSRKSYTTFADIYDTVLMLRRRIVVLPVIVYIHTTTFISNHFLYIAAHLRYTAIHVLYVSDALHAVGKRGILDRKPHVWHTSCTLRKMKCTSCSLQFSVLGRYVVHR